MVGGFCRGDLRIWSGRCQNLVGLVPEFGRRILPIEEDEPHALTPAANGGLAGACNKRNRAPHIDTSPCLRLSWRRVRFGGSKNPIFIRFGAQKAALEDPLLTPTGVMIGWHRLEPWAQFEKCQAADGPQRNSPRPLVREAKLIACSKKSPRPT